MELLAYIQQDIQEDMQQEMLHGVIADSQIANRAISVSQTSNLDSSFKAWLRQLTSKSVKLSFSVILAGTTALIGLGSALSSLAAPSSDITYVQTLLAQNGFDPGEIDGVAGATTKDAIIRAQKTFGLTVDGIAGEQTIAALSTGGTNASPTPASSVGMTVANTDNVIASSSVMNLQKLLSDRGFYNGAVDGIMGPRTRDAIIAAQKAYNLTADGVAGPRTLAALEADTGKATTAATIPTKDNNVASLQELLSKRGFYSGAIDGIMGPQTRLAIVAAQKNYGLVTDGIAGRQTIAALEANTTTTPAAKTSEPATTKTPTVTPQVSQETKNLQELLASRGFYKGAIDGIKGAQTSAAIIAAQKAYGLTADGIAGSQTMTALERDQRSSPPSATAVAPATPSTTGDRNIANLQNLLADRGFYDGPTTGVLGPRTRDAIIAAQKAYGLTADGIAGSRTIAALEAGAAPTATPPVQQPAPAPANTPAIRVETKPQTAVSQPLATPQPAAVATPQPAPAAPQAAPAKPQPAPAAPQPAAITASNTPITELQNLLAKRGFYNGKVDGVLSGETRNAIVRAQNFYTIAPADGAPSNKLVESLSKDTFISSESN